MEHDRDSLKEITSPLSNAQIDQFFDDGFVILPDFVSNESLHDLHQDVEFAIDRLADSLS